MNLSSCRKAYNVEHRLCLPPQFISNQHPTTQTNENKQLIITIMHSTTSFALVCLGLLSFFSSAPALTKPFPHPQTFPYADLAELDVPRRKIDDLVVGSEACATLHDP